ncbi:hypothetical protein JCM10908_007051 [Rhodotorula pacifica]|uniref:uncharacterized protein n=1 Tax=Rhodotorula pacifica TaxID=1495444 RepID=UPI00317C7CDF
MPNPRDLGYEALEVEGQAVQQPRTPWYRASSAKYAAITASIALLVVLAASAGIAYESRKTSHAQPTPPVGTACPSLDLYRLRNNASFWVAEATQGRLAELVIRPADDAYRYCPGLATAAFAVTVHYGNESHALVDPPSQVELGVYRYRSFPPPILETSGSTEFEIRLDFGFYPGGDSGQPCTATACMPDDVAHTGVAFSGDEIFSDTGERVRLPRRPPRPRPSRNGAICTTLDPLPAAYIATNKVFVFTNGKGGPCGVVPVGTTLPSAPDLRWIHILGDSNSRYLVTRLAEMLGLSLAAEHTSEHEKHPTTLVYNDGTGTGIVLSFQWFFVRQDPSDARNLAAIELSSLSAYLASIPFSPQLTWPGTYTATEIRMTDLFLSFGSHAPGLTQSGMRAGMDRLNDGLLERFGFARSTYLLLTAATEPSTIPASYGPQSAMRNNLIIKNAQNAVAAEHVRATSPSTIIVDFFSLTSTTPLDLKKDSVHFLPEVYSAQADLMWTAMHLADLQTTSHAQPS